MEEFADVARGNLGTEDYLKSWVKISPEIM
jgi:hypothetical protein